MQILKTTLSLMLICLGLTACSGGGGGGGEGGGGGGNSSPTFPTTAVSGKVSYDHVPIGFIGTRPGLNYAATMRRPAREVAVEAIDASSLQVLARTKSSPTGDYTLTVPGSRTVLIRALADMKTIGANAVDFSVIDNTSGGAQWAVDGPVFSSGITPTHLQDIHAGSGFTIGAGYDNAQRAAGPFAILDTLYQSSLKIIASDPAIAFPQLDVNWSPANITFRGDLATGQIGFTFFTTSLENGAVRRQIYVLGYADNDTDEYDPHVIAHEFGHYLQSAFSRDDSIGGAHGGANDRLDARLAFSEGFGNAWSGIALNNPIYSDTNNVNQGSGGSFNVSVGESVNPGWFKEPSIEKMFWDFSNSPAIGFTRVWNTLKSGLTRSAALASIHSFAHALAIDNPAAVPTINSILATQTITPPSSPYAENESNFGAPAMPNVRPIYLSYNAVGSTLANICVDHDADPNRSGNKAGEHRYVRLTLPQTAARTFTVTQTSSSTGSSDPDILLYGRNGGIFQSNSTERNTEVARANLPADDYVLVVTDFNLYTPPVTGGALNRNTCFSLTVQ